MSYERIVPVFDYGPNQWSGAVPHFDKIDEDIENVNHQDRLTVVDTEGLVEKFRAKAVALPSGARVRNFCLCLGYWGWSSTPPIEVAIKFKIYSGAEEIYAGDINIHTNGVFKVGYVSGTFTRDVTREEILAGLLFDMETEVDDGFQQPVEDPPE